VRDLKPGVGLECSLISSTLVQNYVSSIFSNLGWYEEKVLWKPLRKWRARALTCQNTFTDSTPIGDVTFTNLIYTFDPHAARRIVLTAHYDSKWFPDFPQNQVSLLGLYHKSSALLVRYYH
jgi:hypothetical protein